MFRMQIEILKTRARRIDGQKNFHLLTKKAFAKIPVIRESAGAIILFRIFSFNGDVRQCALHLFRS